MRLLRAIFTVAVVLCALPAVAQVDDECGWSNGSGTLLSDQTTTRVVYPDTLLYYEWENSGHADCTADDSPVFLVAATTATVYCNMDVGDSNPPASGGVVQVMVCRDKTASANACVSTGSLDGTEGDAASQAAAVTIGSTYAYLRLSTAVPDGDEAVCWIRGEAQ